MSFSMDGIILDANQIFLDVMGYTLDEIKGKHHRMFVEEENSAEYAEFWATLRRGEFVQAEFQRYAKGKREVWLRGE